MVLSNINTTQLILSSYPTLKAPSFSHQTGTIYGKEIDGSNYKVKPKFLNPWSNDFQRNPSIYIFVGFI